MSEKIKETSWKLLILWDITFTAMLLDLAISYQKIWATVILGILVMVNSGLSRLNTHLNKILDKLHDINMLRMLKLNKKLMGKLYGSAGEDIVQQVIDAR